MKTGAKTGATIDLFQFEAYFPRQRPAVYECRGNAHVAFGMIGMMIGRPQALFEAHRVAHIQASHVRCRRVFPRCCFLVAVAAIQMTSFAVIRVSSSILVAPVRGRLCSRRH